MPAPFQASANALFHTEVRRVTRLSPGFVRITLTGAHLNQFAAHGLDQRIKILLPTIAQPAFDDELLHESEWRRRWRDLPVADRPALRSYTTSAVRPDLREIDLDFYVHERPGPASSWAVQARAGHRLLVSGPHNRLTDRPYGIQWSPGAATDVLLAGDETAFPAIRGIASALHPTIRTTIILETGDPADAAWLTRELPAHTTTVHLRGPADDGRALVDAVAHWTRGAGSAAAGRGSNFYAWLATESGRVAQLRELLLHGAGIAPAQVHSQGYWNARPRGARRFEGGA
jgi:NADPH-dependent ferric siderophore reductase